MDSVSAGQRAVRSSEVQSETGFTGLPNRTSTAGNLKREALTVGDNLASTVTQLC